MRKLIVALGLCGALAGSAAVTNVVSNVAELKAAVPKLKWGETLVLKDGVYDLSAWEPKGKDPVFLDLTKHVNLRSESGKPETCVLRGPGERKPGRCLALDGDGSSLSGVTIENFHVKGSGAALWSPAKPGGRLTATDCRFVDCVATGSGGALAGYGLVAVGCTFERCRALNGAGGAGDRLYATRCRFIDCSAKGAGGAGGGGAVAYGRTKDCIFERCAALSGYGIVRNATSEHNVFLDCGGSVGYAMDFRDTKFVRSGSVVSSRLFNCKFDSCHYPTNGASSLISLCTLTNCTISGTTGGDPKRWNSGLLANSTLVDCLVENDRSARVEVKDPSGHQKNPVFIETAPNAKKGWDPEDIKRRRAEAKAAQERKLAAEAKSGVHEIMRIDFDDAKPRKDGGAYGGFWCGIWGDSKCDFSLVPGEGGKGQAMRCNLRGMVGGQLQVFSEPWTMWQNSWYRLRFKARGVDHPGQVGVTVRKYGYPWSMLAWPRKVFHPENEWKEYVVYKQSQHDVSSGFGIMLELGDVGCVDFDWFVVERLDYDPTLKEAAPNRNPPVRGNLLPHGAFETEDDNFYVFSRAATAIWPVWREARMERVPGGHDGGYCVHFPPVEAMPAEKISGVSRTTSSRTLLTKPVPVAAGRNYRLSCWYRLQAPPGATRTVSYCDFRAASGKIWSMGKRFCINTLGWQKLEVVSTKPVPENVSNVQISIEINGYDISLDELDFRMVEGDDAARGASRAPTAGARAGDSLAAGARAGEASEGGPLAPREAADIGPGEMPYEFGLAFDCADPATTPRIVTWGEELPLKLVAMRKRRDEGRGMRDEGRVTATLRVTAYPDKVTAEKKVALKPGEEMKLSVDPKANGILRVELIPDDPKAGVPIEKVMARLPKPRPTGPESYFGTHLRMCPFFVNYAAAIGIKWQRLHDCSNMCKMKWGNPEPGVYQWADEIVDYMRAKNINILALPDYPAQYIMPTNAQGQVVYDNEAYRAWCRELAKHYKGRISHFEIWNEPYMPYFYKRDAKEYGKTFLAGARGIREGNPDAKVIGWCTEFTTPKYVNPFIKDYPVAEKPDYNSVHYYYTSIPGDGDLSYDRIVRNVKDTFGERAGSELWNTEGNLALTHTFYSRMRTFDRARADRGVAFGVRGWAESVAAGLSKVFLYTMHNTDSYWVGGLMTLIDFDRAPTPEAAATAVTAHFIDGRRAVKGLAPIDGCKFQVFVGDGSSVALIWDDVLKEGRKTVRPKKDLQLFDAMGNRLTDPVELGMIPVFAVARGEGATALMSALDSAGASFDVSSLPPPATVTEKKAVPPSGDKRDYMTTAPYWWPDSKKADGLPYVRRDGEVNPRSLEDSDRVRLMRMVSEVGLLAGLCVTNGDRAAGAEASRRLRIFFLDEKTGMRPNLEFAQGIPGRCKGRDIGIIETAYLVTGLLPKIRDLDRSGCLPKEVGEGLRRWFADYLDWLLTSKNGREEANEGNNHSVAYDLQVVGFADFIGRRDVAERTLREVVSRRVAVQIEPDGRMPRELARTRAYNYTLFNLGHFGDLALYGEKYGVELWSAETDDGRSIRKAFEWMKPYWEGAKTWEYAQITPVDGSFADHVRSIYRHFVRMK